MDNARVSLWTQQSSDAELIAGVRAGESAAFGVLFERHGSAARRVAGMYSAVASDIDDIVSEAFAKVLKALQQGDGPDMAFRAYLFTVVRRTGLDMIAKGKRTRPDEDMTAHDKAIGYEKPSDEPALDDFEQSVVADAFRSLPERWQVVLWYTEIEKKSPAEVAPILGLSPNGVAALAYRAREALRQAYLQQHLATTDNVECLAVSENLAAYVRGGLTKREHAKVDAHINACDRCTALVGELEDVNRGLRAVIAPLILGLLGVGALESSLPIGGLGASQLAAAAGSAGGSAGVGGSVAGGAATGIAGGLTAGAAAGVALGVGGRLVRIFASGQGGASSSSAASGFLANTFGAGSSLLTGVAATVGVAALAVASAGILGTLGVHELGDPTTSPTGVIDLRADAAPHVDTPGLPVYVPDPSGGTTDPGTTDPGTTDPGTANPGATNPGATNPGATNPGTGGTGETGTVPTGFGVIAAGHRVFVTAPDGGTFALVLPNPVLTLEVSDPTGKGSTPVTVAFALPAGLTFPHSTDGHGDPQLVADGWTCTVSSDFTHGSCTTPHLPRDAAGMPLTLPVVLAPPLASGATTTVTVSTSIESLAPAEVPTSVVSGGTGGGTVPPDVALTLSAGGLNHIELKAISPTIPVRVANSGDDDSSPVTVTVTAPSGVSFLGTGGAGPGYARADAAKLGAYLGLASEPTTIGDWACDISTSVATCVIATVPAGTVVSLNLGVSVSGILAADAVTHFLITDGTGFSDSFTVSTGLAPPDRTGSLEFAAEGHLGTAVAGGMILSCDPTDSGCATVLGDNGNAVNGVENNNSWAMGPVNTESGNTNSASTTLTLPGGASVLHASLVWAANHGPSDAFSAATNTARLRPPGQSAYITIVADSVSSWTDPGGRTYYQAYADITDLVKQYGAGSWALADIAVTDGLRDTDPSYFAGFALAAVYEDPSLPVSAVAIYGGADPVTKDEDAEYIFTADGQALVDVSVVAWEGDRGLGGDALTLDGAPMTPATTTNGGKAHAGDPGNAFDSTAVGSGVSNTLGTDAKAFNSATVAAGNHTLAAQSAGDNYAVGVVVVQTTPTGTGASGN